VFGVDTIKEKLVPYQSSYLSSGYAALKREAKGNRLYAGLNAMQPGEGHQHADRLNLLTYSRDRMLTGEKSTRYEDSDQRVYSGASYAHNTVTIDETSQVHGNTLKDDRIPHIDTFVDLPAAQVTEAHGDKIYDQTRIYRRLLCQYDEYLLDIFRVEGGRVHDWFYHGVGEEPEVTIPMEIKTGFEPALYVMRGKPEYRTGAADAMFTAAWHIAAEPDSEYAGRRRNVYSRVTIAGVPGQTAFILNTFPDPGAHSLMVRHADIAAPFVAVHEACFDTPLVVGVRMRTQPTGTLGRNPGDSAVTVEVTHADGGRRLAAYESGSAYTQDVAPPGSYLELQGRFGSVEFDSHGRLRGLVLIRGTELRCGDLHLRADRVVSLSMTCTGRAGHLVSSPPVAYETLEGLPVYMPGSNAAVWFALPGAMSPTGAEIPMRQIKLPGQTAHGPISVGLHW
jgi:hypothetical protein